MLLVDPTHDEEDLASGSITIVVGKDQQLCGVHKPGGAPVGDAVLQKCVEAAILRHDEVTQLLDEVVEHVER